MVKNITAQNFKDYGWIIEYPRKHLKSRKRNLFRIVLKENDAVGWRIAYLVVRDTTIKKLERHPESFESFEPVRGQSLLYVAKRMDKKSIECFYLNKPVILRKGVWHGVVALARESEIKLTENSKVRCAYWPLGFRLNNKPIK